MSVRLLKSLLLFSVAAAAAISLFDTSGSRAANQKEPQQMLAHMVFFDLKEPTPENQQKLVDACHKYLTGHPGVVYYSAGARAQEYDRQVNDQKFDVALHVVFKDKASHDKYQTAPRHLEFIEQNKDLWAGVRVFDSVVTTGEE